MFLGSTATRTGSKVLSSSVMPRTTAGASGRPSPKSICCVNTRSPDPSFNPQLAFGTPEPNFPFRITLFFRQPHPRGNPTLTQQNRISVGAQAVLRGRNSVMVYPSRPDATAVLAAHPSNPGTFFAPWERDVFRKSTVARPGIV